MIAMELPAPEVTPAARNAMAPLIDWLLTDGRTPSSIPALLDDLGPRLTGNGIPLLKVFIVVEQLHPEIYAETHIWDRSHGSTVIQRPHGVMSSELYRQSPLPRIFAGAEMVLFDLTVEGADLHYAPGASLKREGATQAIALPLPFSGGRRQAITLVTDARAGFSDHQIASVAAILPALGSVIELHALRNMASGLLDIYVGHDAGARILRGEIRRGSGGTINAVIWFCDLAGFTPLTEEMPRDELISLLNRYFDALVAPVEREGGTILKFIGDAMLAIFPLGATESRDATVYQSALRAARDAAENIGRLNSVCKAGGETPLAFGIALHVGDVMYGNIGAERRLDFTVIGPAVNLTARLESLSRELGHSIVISADFARHVDTKLHSMGFHELRGVRGRQEVFTPE